MHFLSCIPLFALLFVCVSGQIWQANWFTNISQAEGVVYSLHDDQGCSMDGLHVAQSYAGQWYKYYGLYHTLVGTEFQVRLAVTADLLKWNFVRTLLPNADMPYIYQMGTDSGAWIMVAHEQWMNAGSRDPSRLGFKMYYNEADLFAGNYAVSFIAPIMAGIDSDLMGTPNIYSAVMAQINGDWVINSIIGFHYHNGGVDQVGQAGLMGFCNPNGQPNWYIIQNSGYENSLKGLGVPGNIGQRDFSGNTGSYIQLQEGNIGPANPVDWSSWRIWMYMWSSQDKSESYPNGSGQWYALSPRTKSGSVSFGNPFYKVLPHPTNGGQVVVVTYYLFSQGAANGEAGSLLFFNPL